MATLEQKQAITALYVGYFDRAPDPAGLQFWIEQIDNGREFNTIAADFAASDEAEALYPYLTTPDVSSPASFVTNIYANLFGRTPDDEGLDFWVDALESGSVSVGDMIAAIIDGARDDEEAGTSDKSVLDNKVEVGLDFATEAGNTPGFEYDAAAKAAAVAAVNGVTEDEATVEAAKAATDAFVSGDSNPGTGDNLTLTAAIGEEVVGAAGNDSFNAIIGDVVGTDADDTTLNVFDSVDGGAGRDTLNILVDGDVEVSSSTTIENVEVVNMFRTGVTNGAANAINAASFGAAAEELWQINNAGDISGLAEGQAAGFRNTAVDDTVTYADDVTAANVVLQNVTDDSVISVRGDDLTEVSVTASINPTDAEANGDVYEAGLVINLDDADTAEVTALNVSLSQNTDLRIENAENLETVDASASTGGIAIDLSGADDDQFALESAMTGSGVDVVKLAQNTFSADAVSLDTGAGADTIAVALSTSMGDDDNAVADLAITGGAGGDKFAFTAGNIIVDDEAFDDGMGMVSVTDFGTGADTIAIENFVSFTGSFATENAVTQALEALATSNADATLYDAVDAVAQVVEDSTSDLVLYAQFEFDGGTYLYGNASGDDSLDGDMLIDLGGEVLDAGNVVGLSGLTFGPMDQ